MKKVYLTPEVEIISTIASSIIAVSLGEPGNQNDGSIDLPVGGEDNGPRAQDVKEFIWSE